jgi:hypothetical protein
MINHKSQITNNKLNKLFKFGIYVLLVICLEFGIWCLGFAKATFAQEVSLSISPPITEIAIQPGKSFGQVFTLGNSGAPVIIVPKIIPFVPQDSQGHAELVEDKNSIDAFSSWFSFNPAPISLGTAGSHDFNVKLLPPEGTEEKDYYFTFIAEVQNSDALGVNNSQAQARIGANLLITVSKDGNPTKKAKIVNFSAPKIIDSFSTLTYKVLLGNQGRSFFKPTGSITVDQIFGSTTILKLAPLNILAGGNREISCIQGESLIPCKLPGKFLIGMYRANLSFTADDSGPNMQKGIYTIAFPFSIILGIGTIFAIYIVIKKLTR